jgi:molybdopterin-containing oxidoreductase family iron-sulfur binding subunit
MSQSVNETNSLCQWIAPTNHLLESWGDAEPKRGEIHFIQPAISPLFDTRQMEENIMRWSENTSYDASSDQPYYDYIKAHYTSMGVSWDKVLHNGVYMHTTDAVNPEGFSGDITAAANGITRPSGQNMEISFMETISGGNGQFAGNPWLMELPDPVTRTSWGNYLAVPVAFDGVRKMLSDGNVKDGDLVELTINGKTITVPVVQQFGQMPGTVSLALGYGRRMAGKCGTGVGVDVNEFVNMNNGRAHYYSTDVQLGNRMGKEKYYSSVQYHHTMGIKATDSKTGEKINADEAATVFFNYGMVRQGYQGSLTDRTIIFNSNIKDLESNIESLKEKRAHAQHLNDSQIYAGHDAKYDTGHHWGMHVDLNACIGCNACAIACMAENNVPVVGKKEVSRHHEMTWWRIDRYFYGELENPNTVYQPMMCQHCDNAPCENVCPVNATNHSSEGLNQMAYNRCVGTRYCANNCPYKVRRFNWMDYTTADIFPGNQMHVVGEQKDYGSDDLTRMVLNPDVTVRSRGVIEKCSFCVQRIQEGKLTAKTEGRRLSDNDVKTACQTACPTGAITFGDMNNKKGILTEKIESPLTYIALEEINVRSSVHYTMKVNNRDESLDA